jgi:peptide/nickel transport system substrate-binding protein
MALLAILALLGPVQAGAAAAAPVRAVLNVCDDVQDPATLDPQKEFSEKNHTIVQQIFEGLVRFAPDGAIEPALATEWRRLDPNTIQFKLREGVSFHNGEPFDARSVKFSLERYLNPATGFPALGFISSIDRVEIVKESLVNVVTKYPDGLLLNRLAGFILMVPPKYYREHDEKTLRENPVGSGAFRFSRWEKGKSIELTANKDYWKRGYPKVGALSFRFIPANEQFAALKSGEIDVLTELPGTRTTEAMLTGSLKVLKTPTFYTVTGALDSSRPPLSDKRVRQALNHAINKEDLIRYDLMGNGHAIATVTMPGEDGHNARLKPYAYDLKIARRLLKEAGYPDGFSLKVLVKAQSERAAKIMRGQLAMIGVKLDLHLVADAEMIKALTGGAWDVFISNCPDPMAHSYFIQSIFLYGSSPYSLGKNTAYNVLLERMVGALDDGKRRELAEQLDDYVHEEALLLFTYQRIKTCGVRADVDFTPSITGMPYFFGVSKAER